MCMMSKAVCFYDSANEIHVVVDNSTQNINQVRVFNPNPNPNHIPMKSPEVWKQQIKILKGTLPSEREHSHPWCPSRKQTGWHVILVAAFDRCQPWRDVFDDYSVESQQLWTLLFLRGSLVDEAQGDFSQQGAVRRFRKKGYAWIQMYVVTEQHQHSSSTCTVSKSNVSVLPLSGKGWSLLLKTNACKYLKYVMDHQQNYSSFKW